MKTGENCRRKPEFSEGESFVGADGRTWTLPIIDEAAWDRFPQIHEYFEALRVQPRDLEVVGFQFTPAMKALDVVLFALIGANYQVTVEDLEGITWPLNLTPRAVLSGCLNAPTIQALVYIARNGGERWEIPHMVASMVLRGLPIGWCSHAGIMFDN